VIGDTVNIAARVEAATRETGDDVLISEVTRNRLCSNSFEFEKRPPVPLKGKSVHVPPNGKSVHVALWDPRPLTRAAAAASSVPRTPVPD
jgi:hypothetical protein